MASGKCHKTGQMVNNMKSIRERKNELLAESWRLRDASFEITKKKSKKEENFKRARELQEKENEVWKKKMFFENYLREMEKIGK